jgi:hypothetical protein
MPPIGTVAVLTVLYDSQNQPMCVDIKAVNTGGAVNADAVAELIRKRWKHATLLPPAAGQSARRGIF